ncbi:MAG: hypothetical protein JRN68_03945 [Nitrososphaerota archaeon]|nr:hypothetical protein [Nitrososphaerota archaeon]
MNSQSSKKPSLPSEARMIEAIKQIGPRNMSKVSSMTNIPVETVRYKLKRQLPKMGFSIHAQPSYGKLGLSVYWATLRFARQDTQLSARVLNYLGEKGYLVYYSRELPNGRYSANFALPSGTLNECTSNLDYLVKNKILSDYQLDEVTHVQYHSLNPRYFNFRSKRWEVDWSNVKAEEPSQSRIKATQIVSFDKYDLLLLKEFQADALQHTTDIARRSKAATPVLGYHYRTHLQKYGLVDTYMVRWMPEAAKKKVGQTATTVRIRIADVKQKELQQVHNGFIRLPFSWTEHFTNRNMFIATLVVPVDEMINIFDYLNGELPQLVDKIDTSFVKSQDVAQFTVPYDMFERNWNVSYGGLGPELKKLTQG